jgi:hypothetical protein
VSVIDELKGLEDRVARRMKELRPLVDEYRELERVAERLGAPPAPAPTPALAADTAAPRPRASARAQANGAAPAGSSRATATRRRTAATTPAPAPGTSSGTGATGRRDQLLELVKARPGITVREIGTELGVDPTSLYRIVHRLEQDGALRKRGRELLPR